MERTKASWIYKSEADKAADAAAESTVADDEIGIELGLDLRNKLRTPTESTPPPSQKCGRVCQQKKKRKKIILIGLGVVVVGITSFLIFRKK
jgi:hypothetical protein